MVQMSKVVEQQDQGDRVPMGFMLTITTSNKKLLVTSASLLVASCS